MLQAGTRPDNARPAEEDGSRLWLPVMRPVDIPGQNKEKQNNDKSTICLPRQCLMDAVKA